MDDLSVFDVFGDESSQGDFATELPSKSDMDELQKREQAKSQADRYLEMLTDGLLTKGVASVDVNSDIDQMDEENEIEAGRLKSHKRNQIHTIATVGNCSHEVVLPTGMKYTPLTARPTSPAKLYDFELDSFQKEAILCIDNLQSVLVSAHTSAGKTVVALYAIALSMRAKQRVIYTSPIKALSNQKFRELQEEFADVGLLTGDVTLNPDASCLVMTTEILRSMLYRGSEIMKEVGWVIFDEIHYMRDKERGVVWEESIILLPDNVHYVFLSATIPNARQFADWVVSLHEKPVHVVYTDYRPVPLQHFVFPAGSNGIYEVVNIQGLFREENFMEAMSCLKTAGDEGLVNKGKRGGTSGVSDVMKIIRTVKERDMIPCIIFSFSRRECEVYATQMKDMDFNEDDEKALVREIYQNAVSLLSDADQKLPQVGQVLPFLLRGIGVHHSGLLPIVKEVIEILFGEGLLKTLFATETFSMGLNMPARTVMFTSARKFDGKDYRWLTSGEYIQMSGRAGRRGKDDRGLVILMVDQQMGQDVAKQCIKGAPDPLNSQFRLTYNMLLNLLRVEDINPEFMLEHSFYQFQNYDTLPQLYENVENKKKELAEHRVPHEVAITGYYDLEKEVEMLKQAVREVVIKPQNLLPFLQSGRLLHIVANGLDFGWAPLLNFHKKQNAIDPLSPSFLYVLDVAMTLTRESAKNVTDISQLRPAKDDPRGVIEAVAITIDCVTEVSAVRLKVPQNLNAFEAKQSVGRVLKEVLKRFRDILPLLHPVKDMKIRDLFLEEKLSKLELLEKRLADHPLKKEENFEKIYKLYKRKLELEGELSAAKTELKKARSLLHLDELKCRKRVLKRLYYCDENDLITQKGRVACEISSADTLMLTEMMFGGVFTELNPQQMAALLSCFVFEEKATPNRLTDDLSGCLRSMQEYARRIARITMEAKLEIDEDKYVESFKPHLMDVIHAWCSGASFSEILKKTEVFEGSIIRCIRRLEELLREMVGASKAIGNSDLERKFEEARTRIKRDIVFTASLYL